MSTRKPRSCFPYLITCRYVLWYLGRFGEDTERLCLRDLQQVSVVSSVCMWALSHVCSRDQTCSVENYVLQGLVDNTANLPYSFNVSTPSAWYSWRCDLRSTILPWVPPEVPIIGQRDVHPSQHNSSIETLPTDERLAVAENNIIGNLASNVGHVVRAAISTFKSKPKTLTPKSSGCIGNCSEASSVAPVRGLIGVVLGVGIVVAAELAAV